MSQLIKINEARRALENAKEPAELVEIEAKLGAIEAFLKSSGYNADIEELRPVNELRMRARWMLGQALAKVERSPPGPRKDKSQTGNYFRDYIKDLNLNKNRVQEVQRIGTLPDADLETAFAHARDNEVLTTTSELVKIARPHWYKASREKKHRDIASNAATVKGDIGVFPLIYADPPWKFEIYSEKGLERTPDQHYKTLTDAQIIDFKIGGKPVTDAFHKDAVLLLWCTSSNLVRALDVMAAWGFTYKTHAVWVKDKTGLGLVFRNQHEVLLYGTCGKMPGPQYQPPSVFHYPRGEHSAKPPEIRREIEKMYPDFDWKTRIELFARSDPKGWTAYGYEAQ